MSFVFILPLSSRPLRRRSGPRVKFYVFFPCALLRWGVAEDDIDFNNSNAGIIVNGRSRCDIPEFEGMPTPEEVGLWLERNEPVMWRNAVRDWSMYDTEHSCCNCSRSPLSLTCFSIVRARVFCYQSRQLEKRKLCQALLQPRNIRA